MTSHTKNVARPKKRSFKQYSELFLYLSPFLIGIIIFTIYPFLNILLISFQEDYNILSKAFSTYGMENYSTIIQDQNFINSLKNTGLYMLIVVPVSTAIAVIIAVLLNQKIRFTGIFQTAYFLPLVTSVTALGLVWKWMFNFDYGIINFILSLINVDAINWLNDPAYNMAALIIFGIWSTLPFTIIILLAGLQNINEQYYLAARIDGARPYKIFSRITVPLLAPTIGLVVIINTINTSKVFDELFPLFNGQPGAAYSLYTVVYYLYDQFYIKWELGQAAASAVILFLFVSMLTLIQLYLQKKWSNY